MCFTIYNQELVYIKILNAVFPPRNTLQELKKKSFLDTRPDILHTHETFTKISIIYTPDQNDKCSQIPTDGFIGQLACQTANRTEAMADRAVLNLLLKSLIKEKAL